MRGETFIRLERITGPGALITRHGPAFPAFTGKNTRTEGVQDMLKGVKTIIWTLLQMAVFGVVCLAIATWAKFTKKDRDYVGPYESAFDKWGTVGLIIISVACALVLCYIIAGMLHC